MMRPTSKRFVTAVPFLILIVTLLIPTFSAQALKELRIEPLTWNVIGLDSNNVNVGPNHFPVGARVCNSGDEPLTNVKSSLSFASGDPYSGDAYINLRPGTLSAYSADGIDLAVGECTDFYYEVQVTRDANAYEHTREYYITATADGGAIATTPRPRELFVEYLISQSRNSVSDVRVDGVSIPEGGTTTLVVGQTYQIQLAGFTATNGYEQIESFINFPNTIFQVLSVSTDYTADTSSHVNDPEDKLYGDACLWENNPNDPNYRSCLDVGKVGGDITVTFEVKILSIPTNPLSNPQGLSTLIYDFSGSSYHYNSDFSISTRYARIVNASITKAFEPKTINPGGSSTLTFKITNPGVNPISSVHFTDDLPPGLEIDSTTVSYSGCGTPSPASISPGATSLSFSNISVVGFNTCSIEVSVTGSSDGVYNNNTSNLFVGSVDTGSSASDTMVISSQPAPPSSCSLPVEMATWTMPTGGQGSGGPPPDYTTKAPDVSFVTASASLTASGSQAIAAGGVTTNAWQVTDAWNDQPTPIPDGLTAPYIEFSLDTLNYGGAQINFQYSLLTQGQWAANNNNTIYVYSSTDGSNFSLAGTIDATKGSWQPSVAVNAAATGAAATWFRMTVVTRGNQPTSSVWLDNVSVTGCPRPEAPTLSKAFSPTSIPEGSISTLTFTLGNPNSSALTGIEFEDTLPSGLLIANPNGLSQSCSVGSLTGGSLSAPPGSSTLQLSGATLSADANCIVSIDVLGDVAGQYENISGNIASTETGVNTTASGYGVDSLTVITPPEISKSFGVTSILTGGTTSLTFSITNPNAAVSLTGVAVTDVLPAGLSVADGTFSVCGGVNNLTTTAATDTITLSATTIAAGGSCDFSVVVIGSTPGAKNNTTGTVTSTNGGDGNTASATLLVKDPTPAISLLKQVGSSSSGPWFSVLNVATSSNVYFRFTVENIGDVPLSSVNVVDPAAYIDMSACVWTDGDGDALSAPFTLQVPSAGNEDHIALCTLGPIATGAAVGSYSNTATASGTNNSTTVNDSSTATYANPELTLVKSASPMYYLAAGETISYTFDVTNTGFVSLPGPISVSDDRASDENCPAVDTVGDGDSYFDPGESVTCTASYTILAGDVTAGSVTNTASVSVDGVSSEPDSETVALAALTIDKDTSTETVGTNGIVVYSIVVANTGQYDLTNFQMTDALPFNAGEYSVLDVSASVTSGSITTNGSYDGSAVTDLLAGTDTLLAGATATVTLELQLSGATAGTYDNTAAATTDEVGSVDDDGTVADDDGTPGPGTDPETDEDVTAIAGGAITISKDALPDAAQDFAFSGSGPAGFDFATGFSLDDDTDGTLPNTLAFNGLTPGTYSLTEGLVSGWSLTGLSCVDPDDGSSVDVANLTATIDLDAGETVACTYTNSQLGTIIVVKDSQPDGAQDFAFSGSGPAGFDFGGGFSLDDDLDGTLPNSETFSDLLPGSYSVMEALVSGWDLTDLECVEATPGSTVNLATRTASIVLDPGETVTCTFTNTQQNPELTLVKSIVSGGTYASVGDVVSYEFVLTNSGNVALTGPFTVDDDLTSDESCPPTATLTPGVSITCTATYTITQADIDSGSVTNTATASASFNGNPVVSNEDSETANATPSPSIQVVKEVSVDGGLSWFDANSPTGPALGPGTDPRFRFTVENTSNVTLVNLTLGDSDIGVLYESDLATLCTIPGSLAPGGTFVCYGTLAWASGQHSNTATAEGDFNSTTYSDSDDAHYFGTTTAYTITKSVVDVDGAGPGGSVDAAGDVITYRVVVTNTGDQAITGVSLADTLVAAVGSPVESLSSDGTLDVGENWTWTYTYTATQTDIDSDGGGDGDIDNTATVSSNELGDQSDSQAVVIAQASSLNLIKEVSDDNATWVDSVTVLVGDPVYYRVRVENTGNTTLTSLTVTDPACTLVRGSDLSGDDDADFEPGEEWAYYCSVTAVAGMQTNTATADSNETPQDSDNANYYGEEPSLNIVKEISDDNATWVDNVTAQVGETVYYRVRVENTGNITLTNLTVDDGMAGCTLTRGSDITGDDDGDFEAGEEWAYYCSITAIAGTQTNTATADSNETPTDSDTAEYLGIAPPGISKSFSPAAINAGEISTLRFTINNPNVSTDLVGVAFDDTFPTSPGVMVVASPTNASTTCGGTVSAVAGAGSISFSIGTIPSSGSCTVQVDITAPVEGVYANISGFVSSTNGGVGNRASASLIVGAGAIADPAVTKSGNPSSAQVGDTVTFTLQVFNNGSVDATDVVVTDALPDFLDYLGASAPGSVSVSYDAGTHTVTINYTSVTPSDLFTVIITTQVNDLGTPPGGTNTVDLVSESPDADPTNNVDSTPISIVVPSEAPVPETGFAPDRESSIPTQPEGFMYDRYPGLSVEIPALGVRTAIVGVPLEKDGWDVTWLWDQVGYLDGTAFPGWTGNSVLTGHVYLPNGLPGPFIDLKHLAWGDRVIVESFGSRYIYEVRESRLYAADSRRIIRHEETPWLTLITCQSFDEESGTYKWRRVVRAVLMAVEELP